MMFLRLLILIPALFSSLLFAKAEEQDLLVFAASSMRDALLEIGVEYEKQCKCEVKFSFAASSTLARQIDAGAPADIYISANTDWVDWLKKRERINGEAKGIASNSLIIASTALTKDSFNILLRQRFSMADPTGVPAGLYAKQALRKMGLWEKVKSNAVYTENVRIALSMIMRRDLQSGVVYGSDLKSAPELHAHFIFPETSHDKIEYLAAVPKNANENSVHFLDYLLSTTSQKILVASGFISVMADK